MKVSARTGDGLGELKKLFAQILSEDQIYVERLFPYAEAGKIQLIREYGQLLSEEYQEAGIAVKARVPGNLYEDRIKKLQFCRNKNTIFCVGLQCGTRYGAFSC